MLIKDGQPVQAGQAIGRSDFSEERGSHVVTLPRRLLPYLGEALATGLYGRTVDQVAATLLGTQIAHLMAVKILHPHPPALDAEPLADHTAFEAGSNLQP